MFGQFKRTKRSFEGVLTGKDTLWGGSHIRPEATGYGCVFFAAEALADAGTSLDGATAIISGSGNVAQYTAEKVLELGGKPVTFSDSSGYIVEPEGFSQEQVDTLMDIKNSKRGGRVSEFLKFSTTAQFVDGERPWEVAANAGASPAGGFPNLLAFPSATQNEVDRNDAEDLVAGGCLGVFEGANMPCTKDAVAVLEGNGVVFGPGKAANAGGVAVSGLEMAQNASMTQWSREKAEGELHRIMKEVYRQCADAADDYDRPGNLKDGANIAGFKKVADAMIQQGSV